MPDFVSLRRTMVDTQLRTNKVRNQVVLDSMGEIPRETFIPFDFSNFAYVDEHINIGPGRGMVQPMILARMIQAAEISADAVVLDIACGSGYSSAVLARIARVVVALESDEQLSELAASQIMALGLDNVVLEYGDIKDGWPDQAPYDVIMINGACEEIPEKIFSQLADRGKLCAVTRDRNGGCVVRMWDKVDSTLSSRNLFDANVPNLPEFERPTGFYFG